MTVVYFSDFDLKGSGYKNIAVPLCQGLAERGHDVLVFGMNYRGEPHDWEFDLCPAQFQQIPTIMRVLPTAKDRTFTTWITAFDIPLQISLLNKVPDHSNIPWISIFPVEGPPLTMLWASKLLGFDANLVMSRFGYTECEKAGIEADYLEIGVDLEQWSAPTAERRAALRASLGFENKFVILTVADNHERKNLSAAMEIFARFSGRCDAVFMLVTREWCPVGWIIRDLAHEFGISQKLLIWERGIEHEKLRDLYGMADAFLLTSKAEGLGMPVLEAMAMRVPVVATRCCALEEHLGGKRGLLIDPDYVVRDPYGNGYRYRIDKEKAVTALNQIVDATPEVRARLMDRAYAYVEERAWTKAVDTLEGVIDRVTKTQESKAKGTRHPASPASKTRAARPS